MKLHSWGESIYFNLERLNLTSKLFARSIPASPYLVHFLGYFENPFGVAMKLYSGTLKDYLFNDNISISSADKMKIALDVAKGIQHLQIFDIVHFDIKPLNVLLDHDENRFRCAISDLGASYRYSKFFLSNADLNRVPKWLELAFQARARLQQDLSFLTRQV